MAKAVARAEAASGRDPHQRSRRCQRAAAGGVQRRHRSRQRAGRMRAREKSDAMPDGRAEAGRRERHETGATVTPLARRGNRNSGGFIVVAVLWILAALSALVLIYMSFVTNTAVVVAASSERIQTDALATAGVELAAYQLTAVGQEARPSSGRFDARLDTARVFV